MAALETAEFSVEAVVSFFAIIHVDRRRHAQLLQRIHSFLPEGGMLLFTAGHSNWEGQGTFHGVPMQWSHFDAAKYRVLIKDAGFTVLSEGVHRGNDDVETPHPVFLARAT